MVQRTMMEGKELALRFQEHLENHMGILLKVARTYCQQENERQDLVQEMMLQIWRAFPRYNGQYKITTWLYRIVLNVAISHYRSVAKQGVRLPLDEKLSAPAEASNSEQENQLQLLERFISELNDLDKALILLYLEDKSHAEIAEILGISTSNVATKVGRIKDKLKQRFSSLKANE